MSGGIIDQMERYSVVESMSAEELSSDVLYEVIESIINSKGVVYRYPTICGRGFIESNEPGVFGRCGVGCCVVADNFDNMLLRAMRKDLE